MKRELKLYAFGGVRCKVVQNCRAYPDEKGIETFVYILPTEITHKIAEPIPMKRELKRLPGDWTMEPPGLQSLSR